MGDRSPYPPWVVVVCRGGSTVAAERSGAGYGRWRRESSGRRVGWPLHGEAGNGAGYL
jgi:hypothetical protein